MTPRIFIPGDAGALAVGADEVAAALREAAAARHQASREIVRTGSRGLYWLEPLVEVATPAGRLAFGPVTAAAAAGVLDAALAHAGRRTSVARAIPKTSPGSSARPG